MKGEIKELTTKGVRVTLATTVALALLQAALLVVMARLLRPADYGVVAAGMIVVRPLQAVVFSGLERAVLLTCVLSRGVAASITALNACIGLAVSVVMALACILYSEISPLSPYAPILLTLSPLPLIFGLGVTARAHLRQSLEFGKLARADWVSQVGGGAVQLVSALRGWGAYSLVAGVAAQSVLQTAMNIYSSGGFPRLVFNFRSVKTTLVAGVGISKTTILEILHGNLPSIFIGGLAGPISLGLYNRASALIQLPVELLLNSMSRVLFSSFNAVSGDLERLRRGSRGLVQVGGAVAVPICFGAAAAAPDVVLLLLGPRWSSVAQLLPVICVGTALGMSAHLLASLNEATKQFDQRFVVQLITTVLTGLALVLAAPFGLMACCFAFAFGALVFFVGNVVLSAKVLNIRIKTILHWTSASLICGVSVAISVFAVRCAAGAISLYERAVLELLAGVLTQIALYIIFWRETLVDVLHYSGIWRLVYRDKCYHEI